MRGFRFASLCLSLAASAWSAGPVGRTDAATMDPYLPIRNSALQFQLGASYASLPGYYAKSDTVTATSGSKVIDLPNAGSLTQLNLRIRHGFVANTEAILDIPYVLASGDVRRMEPTANETDTKKALSQRGSGDTSAAGCGDWSVAVKSAYELNMGSAEGGVGGYFALVLPVGEALGSGAYCNGDGQIDMGLFFNLTAMKQYQVLTNFVYGFDLPATNRQLDKQDSWSGYLRMGYLLADAQYRPYLAVTYKGYGDYKIDDNKEASGGMQLVVSPGIDLTLAGDFSAELAFDYTVMGSGNASVATNNGWKIKADLKYFWFRY